MTKKRERFEAKQNKKSPVLIWTGSGVIIAVLAALSWWVLRPEEVAATKADPQPGIELRGDEWGLGNPDAKVVIVEYGDYQCGACGFFHPMVKDIVRLYGDRIYFVFRHFPLVNSFQFSQLAASVTEAAGKQGKFWEMHDLVYNRQASWSRGGAQLEFTRYASELGLDMEQFQEDVRSDEVFQRIQRDFDSAVALKMNSVPSFYINGERISNPRTLTDFRRLIDEKLNDE